MSNYDYQQSINNTIDFINSVSYLRKHENIKIENLYNVSNFSETIESHFL